MCTAAHYDLQIVQCSRDNLTKMTSMRSFSSVQVTQDTNPASPAKDLKASNLGSVSKQLNGCSFWTF